MLCCKRFWGSLFCLLVVGMGMCILARVPVWGQDTDAKATKLKALLEMRRDVLKQRLEAFEALVSIAKNSPEDVVAARNDLLDAELALAAGKTQRMEVLQRKLTNSQAYESLMKQRKLMAQANETHVLLATARRLDVEIELLRERE